MVDLKPSTMRPYFASLSRARREARKRRELYGETVRYAVVEVDVAPAAPRKATSDRNRGRRGHRPVWSIMGQLGFVQDDRCYLCGEVWSNDVEILWPTHDHVVPKSQGGGYKWNLLGAHKICNGAKGNRMPLPCELIYLHAVNAIRAKEFQAQW